MRVDGSHFVRSYSCWFVYTWIFDSKTMPKLSMEKSILSFMVLVVVHSSQLYRKIHSASGVSCKIKSCICYCRHGDSVSWY